MAMCPILCKVLPATSPQHSEIRTELWEDGFEKNYPFLVKQTGPSSQRAYLFSELTEAVATWLDWAENTPE